MQSLQRSNDRPAAPSVQTLQAVVVPSIADLDAQALANLEPRSPEDQHYLRACERAPPPGFEIGAIACFAGAILLAAAPFFVTRYDLLLALNSPRLSKWLSSPRLRPKLLCLGSPLTETCPLAFAPHLQSAERAAVFAAMLDALLAHAKKNRIRLAAVKDVGAALVGDLDQPVLNRKFHRLVGLPVAKLALPGGSIADYLQGRSKNFRKDFNRAINKSASITIEHVRDIASVAPQVFALYEQTRMRGGVSSGDFDQISREFVATVLAQTPSAYAALYRFDGELIGFSLILNDRTTAIAKFIGLKYPEANQTGLYRRCLKDLIETAYAQGQAEISFGCLNYGFKVKSGCALSPNYVYFRHANPMLNKMFGSIARHFHYDSMDPDLLELSSNGQYLIDHPPTKQPLSKSDRPQV